jgi:hypothetical protein
MLSLLDPLPVTAAGLDEHRSGWNYAMSIFKDQSVDPRAVCFHPFFEAIFWDEIWDPFDMEHISFKQKVLEKGGFVACLHNPPKIPIYSSSPTINSSRPIKDHHPILTPDYMINESSIFKELAPLCKGIYTLSEYLSSHVRQLPRIIEHNIPVNTLYHPIEPVENKWSLQKFMDNPDKKLLNIGTWLRRYSSIYRIDPKDTYTKCILPKSNQIRSHVGFQMSKWPGMFAYSRDDVQFIDRVSNTEYDKLLERNIVYLHVFDTSANNVIIECIIRNTPIIVNAAPAAIEYLGKDYPLFTTSFDDVERKVHDLDLIEEAHEYLKNYTFKEKLSLEHFKQSIHDSEIYQQLLNSSTQVNKAVSGSIPIPSNFNTIFSTFAEKLQLSNKLFDDEDLSTFCTGMGIDYETRYAALVGNLHFMHAFVCYLKIPEVREVTQGVELPTKSDSIAILPESRMLPHLEFILRNAIDKLPDNFVIAVTCTSSTFSDMKALCNTINENILVIDCGISDITQNSYNNMLLTREFWEKFDYENILIYQQDTMIFREGLEDFLEYDYIGAPWPGGDDNPVGVGNGGLSFRKRSKLLKCLDTVSPGSLELGKTTKNYMEKYNLDNPPEDVYFTKTMIGYKIGRVADRKTANKFSEECVISEDPFGGHQYWLAHKHITDNARRNILVVDDNIPHKSLGQGFNRAQDIVEAMSHHFNVTIYPTNFLERDRDKRMIHYSSLGARTICHPRDKYGDKIFSMVGQHITDNPNYYDIIYLSRPHNFSRLIEYCKTYSPKSKIVYDAEALFYKRVSLQNEITGKPGAEICLTEKNEELNLLSQAENVIMVSESEKDEVIAQLPELESKIMVYGHAIEPIPPKTQFEDRHDLFFLGAFVNDETPNADALFYFVEEIFPIVEEVLGCKLIVGGAHPTKRVMALNSDKIIVKGPIEDTKRYYEQAKVFIIPHRFAAGVPWKLSESLAYGLPTVTSKLIADQMGIGKDIIGVGASKEELAEEIIDMYTDKDRWNMSRDNGLQFIRETHDSEQLHEKLVTKLNEVCK